MVEQADRPSPAALLDDPQQAEFAVPFAQIENFPSCPVAAGNHAVEVHGNRVGLDAPPQLREAVEVIVSVVEIVDQANVGEALRPQPRQDRELVFRFAEPAAVVVEPHRAAQPRGDLQHRPEFRRLLGDAGFLPGRILQRRRAAHRPELRSDAVAGNDFDDALRGGVTAVGEPPRQDLDSPPLHLDHLGVKVRHMFRPPVVGQPPDLQPLQHRGAGGGVAPGRIEWHDTPGGQVVAGPELRRRRRRRRRGAGGAEGENHREQGAVDAEERRGEGEAAHDAERGGWRARCDAENRARGERGRTAPGVRASRRRPRGAPGCLPRATKQATQPADAPGGPLDRTRDRRWWRNARGGVAVDR